MGGKGGIKKMWCPKTEKRDLGAVVLRQPLVEEGIWHLLNCVEKFHLLCASIIAFITPHCKTFVFCMYWELFEAKGCTLFTLMNAACPVQCFTGAQCSASQEPNRYMSGDSSMNWQMVSGAHQETNSLNLMVYILKFTCFLNVKVKFLQNKKQEKTKNPIQSLWIELQRQGFIHAYV